MATLAGVESLEFNELKAMLGLTDGNLSAHLSSLEKGAYVAIEKSFKGKKPVTTIAQTRAGRDALRRYVNLLQGILGQK